MVGPEEWHLVGGRVRVVPAAMGEMPIVAGILDEASAWLQSRGLPGWARPFPVETLEAALSIGTTYLAWDASTPAGTFSLHRIDVRFWGERPGEPRGYATYLHKLAISRTQRGLGREFVALAERIARESGAERLRLDCRSDSPGIRGYYEAAGFRYRGEVSGPAFDAPYALYEKSLV